MTRIVAGSVYVAVVVVLAAVAAWPIYRSLSFLLLVAASVVLAGVVASFAHWRRLNGWLVAAILAGVLLLSGVPLAVPGRLSGPSAFLQGLGELGAGIVVGWKDLLTVELPVGSYRNLLVPALVVFLVGTTVALLLAWRTDAWAIAAVPVGVAMTGFGLLFGRTDVSAPLRLGPLTLTAPVETAVGLGTLAAGVLWLAWRSRAQRLAALDTAAVASGARRRRRPGGADARRFALGAGMVAIAGAAALAFPAAAADTPRTVLREATGPRVEISRAVSPLSTYRTWFTDDRHEQTVFAVAGPAAPQRVRLAVLDDYDGAIFRTATGPGAASFVRMASARAAGEGTAVDATVTMGDLSGLWMPSAGRLTAVDFEGSRAGILADGFYVNDELAAAVEVVPWQTGDSYRLQATEPAPAALASATAPGGDPGGPESPASLRAWMKEHVSGTGGAALEGLVTLLRERGYLSHALTEDETAWMADAGVDTFVPSTGGHSIARIDALFTALLEREQDPRAAASGDLVAAIGDDEQFAVATAMIANELGFPARVVVGARLASEDPGVTVCDSGTCRGDDLSAWVEVQTGDGAWIPVDVTPQHTKAPNREVTAQPDPTIGTEVRPDAVEEVQPPKPAQEAGTPSPDRPEEADLGWVWATLRIAGISLGALAVVFGPFLAIVIAKAVRRRGRRGAAQPEARIAGGWDEYLDAAADAGRRPDATRTRTEAAALLDSPNGESLARRADAAVFSDVAVTDDEAFDYWRDVQAERAALAPTRWRRLRAAVSLRSFVPEGLRRSSSRTERGSRVRSVTRRTA